MSLVALQKLAEVWHELNFDKDNHYIVVNSDTLNKLIAIANLGNPLFSRIDMSFCEYVMIMGVFFRLQDMELMQTKFYYTADYGDLTKYRDYEPGSYQQSDASFAIWKNSIFGKKI